MTTRTLLICSILPIAAVAGWLAFVLPLPGRASQAFLPHVAPSPSAASPQDSGQWSHREPPRLAALESGDTDDTEELSSREKTLESRSRCLPDIFQQAMLTAASQPKVLTTLNALRVRLQI